MDYKTYVQNVVASYIEKKDRNVIFIKHYNTLSISRDEILASVTQTEDEVFLYHEYKAADMHEAYAPFLDWIRTCYDLYYKDKMTAEAFLKECHVHPMHLDILAAFINNGVCTRREDAFQYEVKYEKERMMANVHAMLEYISHQHHLVMIISKFHLAPYSTIKLLREIMNRDLHIHAIVMYNDEFTITTYKKNEWDMLLQDAESQNLQLEWSSMDSERTLDVIDEFWFDNTRIEEYKNKLTNMYHTFALEDAYYYISDILFRLDEKTIWLTKIQQLPFLLIAANVDMSCGQVNHALVICDKMTDICTHVNVGLMNSYLYYYTFARARSILSQTSAVEECCKKCVELAKKMDDDFLECKAETLLWSSYCGFGKEIFEYDFIHNIDMKMVEKAKKYGFTNFLAYMYVFGFENDEESIRSIALNEKQPYYFNLGIQIGKALENENFLMTAYMKNIILYSRAGYHNYVRKMYKKRLEVLRRPNPLREAHMFAGLGYNSIILEDHEKAHEYLMKSLITLTDLEEPDDIMNSLYNLAMNYFVAEAYKNCIDIIDLLLKILKELGYQSIQACSTVKLYSMIAISCYYEREYYNSYYYLSKMEVFVEHTIRVLQKENDGVWDEDLLLYHLVKAMLYSYENNFDLSQKEFDLSRKHFKNASGARFFAISIFAVEQAELYRKTGQIDEIEEDINSAIDYCDNEGLERKKSRLIYYREHGERPKEPMFDRNDPIPVTHINQVIRQAASQNKLQRREKDIRFLTVLQEAISRENMTVDDLFQNTSAVLKNSYNLDEIIILNKKDGIRTIMHGMESAPMDAAGADEVFDFFKNYKQAFLTNRTDKNFTQFLPVMKSFDGERILTMIGIPIMEQSGNESVFLATVTIKRRTVGSRVLLGSDDLMILKFAFSQFCEMMRRIDNRMIIERMNQKLEQSAITDHLTGITNRNGFSRQVEILCAQGNERNNVILYLDLDNFKYYNDTFGHEIGDLVLVCFAEMFKRMTEGKGLAVRYGGDEFIILLYDQSEQDGEVLAKKIYDEINDGFKEKIEKKLNKEVLIPEDKKISCSIGIASFRGGSKESLELALNQADQMLYYVKRHGKSKYKLYQSYDNYDQQ